MPASHHFQAMLAVRKVRDVLAAIVALMSHLVPVFFAVVAHHVVTATECAGELDDERGEHALVLLSILMESEVATFVVQEQLVQVRLHLLWLQTFKLEYVEPPSKVIRACERVLKCQSSNEQQVQPYGGAQYATAAASCALATKKCKLKVPPHLCKAEHSASVVSQLLHFQVPLCALLLVAQFELLRRELP